MREGCCCQDCLGIALLLITRVVTALQEESEDLLLTAAVIFPSDFPQYGSLLTFDSMHFLIPSLCNN